MPSLFKWTAEKKTGKPPVQQNLPFATGSAAQLDPMETDVAPVQHRDVLRKNVDKGKSGQTSWLYQCMITECFCTFERLADLRMHFVASHKSGTVTSFHAVTFNILIDRDVDTETERKIKTVNLY